MIILYSLQKLNGERTIYSIFHLLHGKQSSQTIQDAFLYRLTPLFNTYPFLSRQELEEMLSFFKTNEWVRAISDNDHYCLTEEGECILAGLITEKPIPRYLDGMNVQKQSLLFWERLSLLVQVISYLQKRDSKYIPIQKNQETIHWIRMFLKQNRYNRKTLGMNLHSELVSCLEKERSINPNLIVVRLSGYHSIGLTIEQAAQKFNLETTHFYYEFLNILHFMVTEVQQKAEKFPILHTLIEPTKSRVLTQSAEKTMELLQQGYSLLEIIDIRQLKKGTIEDHIVELALKINDFSIEPYVTVEKQEKIKRAASQSMSKQLKVILNMVEDVTYFQIRLVLAKYGDG
ncbi:helix-turn-helix domain-containing protein [Niallia sp. XMNu-256]|uniref:helix-turn-helix domain-containing protein n=1 Tax=Niallia sp. XMNu-256 TaxID=3082444 RepID=UPI0030CBCD10